MPKYDVEVNYFYTQAYRNTIEVEASSKREAEKQVQKDIEYGSIDPEEEGWDSEIFDPTVEAYAV